MSDSRRLPITDICMRLPHREPPRYEFRVGSANAVYLHLRPIDTVLNSATYLRGNWSRGREASASRRAARVATPSLGKALWR